MLYGSLMLTHELDKSGFDLAHCILLVIYQGVEIQALVVAARELNQIPALDAVFRDRRSQHIGVRDFFKKRHLRQTIDTVDLPPHRLLRLSLYAENVSVDDLRQTVKLCAQDGGASGKRM